MKKLMMMAMMILEAILTTTAYAEESGSLLVNLKHADADWSGFEATENEANISYAVPFGTPEYKLITQTILQVEEVDGASPLKCLNEFLTQDRSLWQTGNKYIQAKDRETGIDSYTMFFLWKSAERNICMLTWIAFIDEDGKVVKCIPHGLIADESGENIEELSDEDSWRLAKIICSGDNFTKTKKAGKGAKKK